MGWEIPGFNDFCINPCQVSHVPRAPWPIHSMPSTPMPLSTNYICQVTIIQHTYFLISASAVHMRKYKRQNSLLLKMGLQGMHRDSNPGHFTPQSTDLTAPPLKLECPSNASLRFLIKPSHPRIICMRCIHCYAGCRLIVHYGLIIHSN